MKTFKRAISMLLTAAIMMSVMVCGTVSAGAASQKRSYSVSVSLNDEGKYAVKLIGFTMNDYDDFLAKLNADGGFLMLQITFDNGAYLGIVDGEGYGTHYVYGINGKETTVSHFGMDKEGITFFFDKSSSFKKDCETCKTAKVEIYGIAPTGMWSYVDDDSTYEVSVTWNTGDAASTSTTTTTSKSTKDISDCTFSTISNKVYTGKARTPDVEIKVFGLISSGVGGAKSYGMITLVKGTDYTLSYKNNKKIGTATVTITGKGKYSGTKTVTFKIVPRKTTLSVTKKTDSKATFKWSAVDGAEKYQIYYSENGGSYKKLATVSGSKTSCTITSDKLDFSKNTYKFKIRSYATVSSVKYYSSLSKAVSAK